MVRSLSLQRQTGMPCGLCSPPIKLFTISGTRSHGSASSADARRERYPTAKGCVIPAALIELMTCPPCPCSALPHRRREVGATNRVIKGRVENSLYLLLFRSREISQYPPPAPFAAFWTPANSHPGISAANSSARPGYRHPRPSLTRICSPAPRLHAPRAFHVLAPEPLPYRSHGLHTGETTPTVEWPRKLQRNNISPAHCPRLGRATTSSVLIAEIHDAAPLHMSLP